MIETQNTSLSDSKSTEPQDDVNRIVNEIDTLLERIGKKESAELLSVDMSNETVIQYRQYVAKLPISEYDKDSIIAIMGRTDEEYEADRDKDLKEFSDIMNQSQEKKSAEQKLNADNTDSADNTDDTDLSWVHVHFAYRSKLSRCSNPSIQAFLKANPEATPFRLAQVLTREVDCIRARLAYALCREYESNLIERLQLQTTVIKPLLFQYSNQQQPPVDLILAYLGGDFENNLPLCLPPDHPPMGSKML